MNLGRFCGAALGVWVVRVALNWVFYTQIVRQQYEQVTSAHPDMFREVITAYIVTDLIFAVAFAFLFVKVSAALGGGLMAGVKLGIVVAILSPMVGILYQYFSFTFLPAGLVVTNMIFYVIAHVIQGVVAGLIYKP